jgi:hypothetical protein
MRKDYARAYSQSAWTEGNMAKQALVSLR